jgi:DNA-binding CsgD family transcriptional regulator
VTRGLTPAEKRVLRAYIEEETHASAAQKLQVSTQTLKNHLGSIYKKLGVRKAHSAIYRLAQDQGVDPLADKEGSAEGYIDPNVHLIAGEHYGDEPETADLQA